jgi:integrase
MATHDDDAPRTSAPPRRRGRRGRGSVFQRADGRWVGDLDLGIVNGKRRRKRVYGRTAAEATEKLETAIAAKRSNLPQISRRETAAGFLRAWVEDHDVAPSTKARYRSLIELHIIPSLGERKPLSKVGRAEVRAVLANMRSAERPNGKPFSASSVRQAHAVMRVAFSDALDDGLIATNPALGMRRKRSAEASPPPPKASAALSRPQVAKLHKAAWRAFEAAAPVAGRPRRGDGPPDGTLDRNALLFVVAVGTGMRLGELLALRWGETGVDLKRRRISVQHSLDDHDGQPRLSTTKTGRGRSIRISEPVAAALGAQRERQLAEGLAGCGWVFADRRGGPLRKTNVLKRSFRPLLEAAGLPRVRIHDLRHTCATLLFQDGWHPKEVQELLGHSTITITLDTYSHVLPTMHDAQAERLGAVFGG